jgi:hypothetical protein
MTLMVFMDVLAQCFLVAVFGYLVICGFVIMARNSDR